MYGEVVQCAVKAFADRVLDAARLGPGMTFVDVGAGEGLLAFDAIERIGPALNVILTDISAPMLRHAEQTATLRGVREQCRFVECPADDLSAIADASVDVVATRAVLAYVDDKRAALQEFYRVLKPGGRISLAEPIFQDEAFFAIALRMQLDDGTADRFRVLLHRWKAAQLPDTDEERSRNPLVNFSERSLLNFACATGFVDVHLELHIDVTLSPITSWEVFLDVVPHPWSPSLRTILDERFTAEEREFFERTYRPTIESGANMVTDRIAYLTASKPA